MFRGQSNPTPAVPLCWLSCVFLIGCCCLPPTQADERTDTLFENSIRPVLVGTCFRCHGDTKVSGMLRVDSRESLLTGGESGAAVVPGKPEESLLIKAIRRHPDVSAMPPEKEDALRPDQVAAFESWITAGADWPEQSRKFEATTHWAFQPVRDVELPIGDHHAWAKNSIDTFILANQRASEVLPAEPATKPTLIRRATFDLTGLPPTPDEVDAFQNDSSPEAFEKLIDRLLESPGYGERWGRHWLDVVRYADTAGETADYPVPLAWRYRNYVIDSFNADKPYDQFLQEQIAGDVLANQGSPEQYAERVTATGYLAISRRFGFDSENYHHLTIQDTIDTLGQSVLGLSLGCARCHDHKFDAVSMNDYYGLYGIFDSSRYAFPGSEQKQKFRSMVPLLPPGEAVRKWHEFDQRVGAMATSLEMQKQPVPAAILRSLNDLDGDFEMQAPAAGGSNGVLVPPWLYEGKIAVTNAAQSPFRNLYARGKVGASLAADAGNYRIAQSLYPRRTGSNCSTLYVNLDFRTSETTVAAVKGSGLPLSPGEPGLTGCDPSLNHSESNQLPEYGADCNEPRRRSGGPTVDAHRFWIGSHPSSPAVVVMLTSDAVSLQLGDVTERIASVKPNEWHNLQLCLKLTDRTVSGTVGKPGELSAFAEKPLSENWSGMIDFAVLESSNPGDAALPGIEFDNLGVQEEPIPVVSTDLPGILPGVHGPDPAELSKQLQELVGMDCNFELQAMDSPPSSPWGPGPNSVVAISGNAQSPYQNVFPRGELGIHMPNRGEYDGFGLTLPTTWTADATERLFACFDFCCADSSAGSDGSWRYYVGHGPGNSAAVELFFNGMEFYRRSGDAKDAVCPLSIGEWYQVRLSLDLRTRSYSGVIASTASRTEFTGDVANGWDGTIDYSFIDSYGHIGGVRPALHADNYLIRETAMPALDPASISSDAQLDASRRERAIEIRQQLAAIRDKTQKDAEVLNALLTDGPFPMTYGMAEGTPHNVRTQLRGEPGKPGDEIPRGFIKALGGGPLPENTPGSGRLELATWLTQPDNPLTARVMVNRIWQYHFGRGLVRTPNDFGVRGLPPTHPELLDHLTACFVRSGWSVKSMHRLIMLSATYQQSSFPLIPLIPSPFANAEHAETDHLYSHFPRRRLSAEEIRDSILAITGELDHEPAEEHPFPSPISWGFTQHGPFNAVYENNKRSVYLMTQRLKRHPFLALFDGPDPNATTADRLGTTVPTQALFFLNDPFVHTKADAWSERLQADFTADAQRIEQVYRMALGRSATDDEQLEAAAFLVTCRTELSSIGQDNIDRRALAAFLRTIIGSNEFLHVD